jgi:hypothetical protein
MISYHDVYKHCAGMDEQTLRTFSAHIIRTLSVRQGRFDQPAPPIIINSGRDWGVLTIYATCISAACRPGLCQRHVRDYEEVR